VKRLRQLLDESLTAAEQQALQLHLDECPTCQQALDRLAAGGATWDRAAVHLGAGADSAEPALERVVRELESEPPSAARAQASGLSGPETQAEQGPDHLRDELSFLDPPTTPGHLGRLGHYEVLEVVGRGGMGVVLKAVDERLQRIVAIKVLGPQYAGSGSARKRFAREARAAAAVSHDHVVPIYHVEDVRGTTFLVMPLIVGKSLQDRIDQSGPLGVKEVLRIGMQIALGLAAAHQQGLVHRDIKPANILLENGVERVRITDFGLARAIDDAALTQSGVITGTPMFMSPEQARGEYLVDHRSDLFSLGSVMYMMATGRPPFRASGTHATLRRVIDDTPRPMHEVNPEVPAWLEAIVARLHAKDPADRFQTAAEVAELLRQHLAYLQDPHHAPAPPPLAPIPDAAPGRVTMEKILDAADTWRWQWLRGGLLASGILVFFGFHAFASVHPAWFGLLSLMFGLTAMFWLTRLKLCWEVRYRGHIIRFEHSFLCGSVLIIDGQVTRRDWIGWRRELRGAIVQGEAAGAEVIALSEPAFLSFRCRILVEPQTPRSGRAPAPSRGRALAWRWFILGLILLFFFVAFIRTMRVLRIGEGPARPATASHTPVQPERQELFDWGKFIDPRGDCWVESTRDGLTITVPGGPRSHDLNPLKGHNLDAPRVLQEVVGDFRAQVMLPPFAPPLPSPSGGAAYVSAGLVLWGDSQNFLRFQRAAMGRQEAGKPYAHSEWYRKGEPVGDHGGFLLEGIPTYFQIERRGQQLHLRLSPDGKDWQHWKTITDLPLPNRVQIGVLAVNSTVRDFTAQFEHFALTPVPAKE
jgi:hypothetical protein